MPYLLREEMERIIQEEGGSILHNGTTITRIEDLPYDEELTDNPDDFARQRADLEAQIAAANARLARIPGGVRNPAAGLDPTRVTHPHSAGRPPEGQPLPRGDRAQSGTNVSVDSAVEQTFGARVVASEEGFGQTEDNAPTASLRGEQAGARQAGGRRSRAAEPATTPPAVYPPTNIPSAPGDTPTVPTSDTSQIAPASASAGGAQEESPLPPAAQEAQQSTPETTSGPG